MGDPKEKQLADALKITFLKVPSLPGAVAAPNAIRGLMGGMAKETAAPVPAAMGSVKGFPLAVAWTKRGKQGTLLFYLRFRRGSLKGDLASIREGIDTDAELLSAISRSSSANPRGTSASFSGSAGEARLSHCSNPRKSGGRWSS